MSSLNVQSVRSNGSAESGAPSEFANNQGSDKRSNRDSSPNKDGDTVPMWRRGKTTITKVNTAEVAAGKKLNRKKTLMD